MMVLLVVLLCLVALFGALVLVGLFLPRRWRVERSIVVPTSPDRIYPLIANFQKGWRRWNAFGKDDPSLEISFSGPEEGVGATQNFRGKRTPAGEMRIVEADPKSGVRYVMRAGGFELTGSLSFEVDGADTNITWADEGTISNPLFRYFTLFAERAVGKPFEVGLAALQQELSGDAR
jgi:hypothetical protein